MERATNAADRLPDAPPILTDDLVRRFTLAPEEEAWAYTVESRSWRSIPPRFGAFG